MIYKHLKTNNLYEIIKDDILNCTNKDNEERMVLYIKYPFIGDKIFVREYSEFHRRFKLYEINSSDKSELIGVEVNKRELRLQEALLELRAAIDKAPSELITDTIWVNGDSIIDYIDVMLDDEAWIKHYKPCCSQKPAITRNEIIYCAKCALELEKWKMK